MAQFAFRNFPEIFLLSLKMDKITLKSIFQISRTRKYVNYFLITYFFQSLCFLDIYFAKFLCQTFRENFYTVPAQIASSTL